MCQPPVDSSLGLETEIANYKRFDRFLRLAGIPWQPHLYPAWLRAQEEAVAR
jgi:hypothetical protein